MIKIPDTYVMVRADSLIAAPQGKELESLQPHDFHALYFPWGITEPTGAIPVLRVEKWDHTDMVMVTVGSPYNYNFIPLTYVWFPYDHMVGALLAYFTDKEGNRLA